jgi:hypothetical protein
MAITFHTSRYVLASGFLSAASDPMFLQLDRADNSYLDSIYDACYSKSDRTILARAPDIGIDFAHCGSSVFRTQHSSASLPAPIPMVFL